MTLRVSLGKNYNTTNFFSDSPFEYTNKKTGLPEEPLKDLLNRGTYNEYHDDIQGFLISNERLFNIISKYFPISNDLQTATITLKNIVIKKPTTSYEKAKEKQLTYAAEVCAVFSIAIFSVDDVSGSRSVDLIKTQEVYLFDLPIMTFSGNFLINGVERIIISQIHRSPGIIYNTTIDNLNQQLYSARIIPYQGSWLDFEIENNDNFICRINKKRKFSVINILSLFDVSRQDSADLFYGRLDLCYIPSLNLFKIESPVDKIIEYSLFFNLNFDILDNKGNVIAQSFTNVTKNSLLKQDIFISPESILEHGIVEDCIIAKEGSLIEKDVFHDKLKTAKEEFKISTTFVSVYKTPLFFMIYSDHYSREASLRAFFKTIRPGSQFAVDDAERLFAYTFQNQAVYDLTEMGRVKLNDVLGLDIDVKQTLITKQDVVAAVKKLLYYKKKSIIDLDVDSLTNRRIRLPSELIENAIKSSVSKLSRSILEKVNSVSLDNILISSVVQPINSDIREFFLLSQLSQLEDQTNPLTRISHKRRISSLGPGGISKTSSGGGNTLRLRDIHITHYGRICPIETPEGQNIGLISNLATFAKIDKYGFISTPFIKVKNKKLTNQVEYLSPGDDANHYITTVDQINFKNDKIVTPILAARYKGEIVQASADMIEYVDFRSNQLVSVGASLIPFIENTDASRALMGANMQRQALPLLKTEVPLIGTGFEQEIAKNTHDVIRVRNAGIVQYVSCEKIAILVEKNNESSIDIYKIFDTSPNNGGTANLKRPIVSLGQYVEVGQPLTDGPSILDGEIALGKNLLVGFMPWNGFNFEDSIVLSEKVCSSGTFESLHITEHVSFVKDTRIGPEELTRNIPGADSYSLRHLDDNGIVIEGSYVEAGDIIVGKVSPKVQELLTPEEKLLKAIFGDKSGDKKDSSLVVPSGVYGIVIGVKILTKRGYQKCQRALEIEHNELKDLAQERDLTISLIYKHFDEKVNKILLEDGYNINEICDEHIEKKFNFKIKSKKLNSDLNDIKNLVKKLVLENKKKYDQIASSIVEGDEIQQSNLSIVKVYIATKRNLQPGDKMAGRHGNKGVVSKIFPVEDMPFLEDGTPLDIVLNSLGIPSRMNIGQILETHLGLVSKTLGKKIDQMLKLKKSTDDVIEMVKKVVDSDSFERSLKHTTKDELEYSVKKWAENGVPFACQSFGGFSPDDITQMYKKLGLDESGQTYLYDGLTGERFKRKVTVGYIYMLRLHHMVDDKIHARSVGTYGLITQQPLGGRANFGAQRFGEMECWALQAYGAAYTLQEMMTVKSDDVDGRSRMYESIIKGDTSFTYGTPESFKVLVRELNSLAININLESDSW
jgi:DNA-directed RNA polymerase beta subunit